ncbi:MAG TPA: hypothetical protein EYO80_07025, partial [Candidatus Marinimicrobia bacterium]|nr:hypothetical protein [Candidatus Neomarinimicrobiota bacterium]
MKQNLALLSILLVGFFSLDCAGTQQDTIAKTQNVDFLINQGRLNWEQRTDSLALKNAEHFISLAYERRPTQLDLAILYGQILYTRGLFIEKNIETRNGLFLKGSQLCRNAVLNHPEFS